MEGKNIGIRIWFSIIAIGACVSGAALFMTEDLGSKIIGAFFFLIGIFLLGVFWFGLIRKMNITKKALLICVGIFIMGGGILALAPRIYTTIAGEHVTAKIEGFEGRNHELTTTNPLPRYSNNVADKSIGIAYVSYEVAGEKYLSSLNQGSHKYRYGQLIEVVYLPDNPEKVYVYGLDGFGGLILLTLAGMGVLLLGIHMSRKK